MELKVLRMALVPQDGGEGWSNAGDKDGRVVDGECRHGRMPGLSGDTGILELKIQNSGLSE